MITLAIVGLITFIATSIVIIAFWKRQVVIQSQQEQMITFLIGIGLTFSLAFVYTRPPDPGVCAVQRAGLWISYSIIFGALLVKIVRNFCINFQPATRTSGPLQFTGPYYNVLFTGLIILGQATVVFVELVMVVSWA